MDILSVSTTLCLVILWTCLMTVSLLPIETKENKYYVSMEKLRSLCHAEEFEQEVFVKGCHPLKIQNKRCIGVCITFYEPYSKELSTCVSCTPKTERISLAASCMEGSVTRQTNVSLNVVQQCACLNIPCYNEYICKPKQN